MWTFPLFVESGAFNFWGISSIEIVNIEGIRVSFICWTENEKSHAYGIYMAPSVYFFIFVGNDEHPYNSRHCSFSLDSLHCKW